MRIIVTGANGFIGRNLCLRMSEIDSYEIVPITRETNEADFEVILSQADAVVHLAGVNRPECPSDFTTGNADLTERLCNVLSQLRTAPPVIYTSSIQADNDSPYGVSKREAEQHLEMYARQSGAPVAICRLVNVFGKWCRPNYNSAVATFCHNIARKLPISVNDPLAPLQLVYVDDVMTYIMSWLQEPGSEIQFPEVGPIYRTTVGLLADKLKEYHALRETMVVDDVGIGLGRALYATYVSYLDPDDFTYPLIRHGDERGVFVEMLKTKTSGQFSYFTAHPGITRGGHYHHTKTEKFLVLKGRACFRFRHMLSGETKSVETRGGEPVIVETVPGWTHDITNIGEDEMTVMLWANEIFDRQRPDTITSELAK